MFNVLAELTETTEVVFFATMIQEKQMNESTKELTFPFRARIFLVEDEILVAEDIKERLTNCGYTVVGTAASGKEAIEAILQSPPDLIIMDVRIAGELNGIESAIILQSYFDDPIPLIFLTGFSEKTFAYLKVLEDYIYLNKPFHETVLIEAVERALAKNRGDRLLESNAKQPFTDLGEGRENG